MAAFSLSVNLSLFLPGEGSRMVRELFVMAREHAPSIIFMDEIDSIGSTRIESGSGGDSEVWFFFASNLLQYRYFRFQVQRTMLELLNQLDGFEATKNIKVISFKLENSRFQASWLLLIITLR